MFRNSLEERGGKGLQRAHYVFFKKNFSPRTTCPLRAHAHSQESPNKGGQNQNWLPEPCLLGGPKVGGNATSPLHSRGSPTKGTKSKHEKKQEKNRNKNFSFVPLTLPRVLQINPAGV